MRTAAKRIAASTGFIVVIAVMLLGYNALRHLVFWAPNDEISFESPDGVVIRGSLIKPSEDGVHPVVVMLHGSGPESRSGPGYRVLTNAIVRAGVAVLFYDKRGTGDSGGDFETATYADFIADAIAAVRFLAERDDIDTTRIGLHGNSESGWFTPEIAYTSGQVAFIFNRVGPPLPWMQNVIWEVRNDLLAAGIAEADLEPLLDVTMRRWQYYVAAAADPSLAAGGERDAINAELERLRAAVPGAAAELPAEVAPYDRARYADLAIEVGYDPTPYLEAIDVPLVYAFGETDINVPTARSVAYLEEFRRQNNKDIEIVVFAGVGHPMAHWTGLFYGGYLPGFMAMMEEWYSARAVSRASASP